MEDIELKQVTITRPLENYAEYEDFEVHIILKYLNQYYVITLVPETYKMQVEKNLTDNNHISIFEKEKFNQNLILSGNDFYYNSLITTFRSHNRIKIYHSQEIINYIINEAITQYVEPELTEKKKYLK